MATPVRNRNYDEDDDGEIVFDGTVTKKEMLSMLEYYNLRSPTYLEPLSKLQKTDTLDEDLLTHYWNIFEIRCSEDGELDNPVSVLEKSLHNNELKSLEIEESLEGSSNDDSQWTDVQPSEEMNKDDSSIILVDLYDSKTESMEAVEYYEYEHKSRATYISEENDYKNSVQCNNESIATKVEKDEINQMLEKDIVDLTLNEDSLEENKSSYNLINCTADDLNVSTLNDTLEEMEMLMKYGENYMQKNISTVESKKLETSLVEKNNSCIEDEQETISNFYASEEDEENKENVIKVTATPLKNEYKRQQLFSSSEKIKNNKSPNLKQPNTQFKIPVNKPLSARKSPNYKNIVSPIGLYIRNSPQVPLIHKVAAPTNHACTFKDPNVRTNNYEKELDIAAGSSCLPTRSYKPSARNIFISKEVEPSMPCNVRKLIKGSLGPEIIKHVGRIKNNEDVPSTPTQTVYNDGELTILSSTDVTEDASRDVSLYISKNSIKK